MTERASLVWAFRGDEVLLIHKKRGLGAGKINAPGGRLEPGESWAQAASRELAEETGSLVEPGELTPVARLGFRFVDGYELDVVAFFAPEPRGTPIETDEALPFWCSVASIPWPRLWKDDALWLPPCLSGHRVEARFVFDGDEMLEADVRVLERSLAPNLG